MRRHQAVCEEGDGGQGSARHCPEGGGRVCARASEIEVRRNRSRNRLPEAGEGQWQVLGLGTAFDPEELKELQIPASLQQ